MFVFRTKRPSLDMPGLGREIVSPEEYSIDPSVRELATQDAVECTLVG